VAEPADVDPSILAYYASGREQGRLQTEGQLEFLRTQELLARSLPRPPAWVLDVGGGAGIHAVPLIAAGYEVTLVDPVEFHVQQARVAGVTCAEVGEARGLRFSDESFDAVLMLGLYT
jgi:ubiquinone/menaquinone biosynthesis C-methylase UbiE